MINKTVFSRRLFFVVVSICYVITFLSASKSLNILNRYSRVLSWRIAFIDTYKNFKSRNPYEIFNAKDSGDDKALVKLQEMAESAGMRLDYVDVSDKKLDKQERVAVLPIKLSLSGPESALISFLGLLRGSEFLNKLVRLSVKPDAKSDNLVQAQIYIEKIDYYGLKYIFRKKSRDAIAQTNVRAGSLFKSFFQSTPKNMNIGASSDTFRDLALVGIVDDGNLKAVIEDKKTQKAVFLKKDDCIGDLCIAQIKESEVLLEGNGNTYSLVL